MSAPPSIHEHIDTYRGAPSQPIGDAPGRRLLCKDFIDQLLRSLGWETDQPEGGAKRDAWVTRDVPFRVVGQMEHIDYVLRTRKGGVLAIMIADPSPEGKAALDLRRFAWNAGMKLGILTNLAETIVYDAAIPVHCRDDAATALIATIPVDQYAAQWDQIAAVFSRNAVLQGSIERFIRERGGHEGAATEVGRVLRADIEEWRLLLAKRIALRNHGLSADTINELVHALVTGILFLRIVEDRGIGQYGTLMRVTEGGSAWGRLCGLFRYAEDAYGGGLFRFTECAGTDASPDALLLTLNVDDAAVKTIITRLSPPQSPYEFSALSARTLAEVFSPFLGSVVRITAGHHAAVEERPERRNAGCLSGIPQEVAGYIAESTLSALVKGKTPREIAALHVLDPACGSGLFLVMAYEFLLDWHLWWYREHLVPLLRVGNTAPDTIGDLLPGPGENGDAALPVLCCTGSGEDSSKKEVHWNLAAGERSRILHTAIHGVDTDRRAVATTKLLLTLTYIGDGDQQGLMLPDLSGTIRCGNSLVGPDIFDDPDATLLDPRARERLRVFDWEDAFPSVMAAGGFSAITTDLPMVRRESLKGEKEYLEKRYMTWPGTADLYHCFVEKGIALLRPGGLFSARFPSAWLRADNGTKLRMFLGGFGLLEIIDCTDPGTRRGDVPQFCIVRVAKEPPAPFISVVPGRVPETGTFEDHLEKHRYSVPVCRFAQAQWILSNTGVQDLVRKVRNVGTPLGEYVLGGVYRGIRIDPRSPLCIDNETKKRIIAENPGAAAIIRPFLSEEELGRYLPPAATRHLIVVLHETELKIYPAVARHLMRQKGETVHVKRHRRRGEEERPAPDAGRMHTLQDTGISPDLFAKPKIMFPKIAGEAGFTLDQSGHYCPDTCRIISTSSLYLLGILNSRLTWFFIRQTLPQFRGDCRKLYGHHFENIPVFVPDFEDPDDTARHDALEALVQQMLTLQERSARLKDSGDAPRYRLQIAELDRRIDAIVYDLYGLTPDEIRIVEDASARYATSV
jgi:hypothetical protein